MIIKRIPVVACLFLAACSGQGSGPGPEDEPTAYEDMTFEQRHELMSDVVLPRMRDVFVAFDPKFESMSCVTCHGAGASDGALPCRAKSSPCSLPPRRRSSNT